eukprot:SAG25_NODE_520_length_7225_cov_3.754420_11_plen_262_part_00
MIITPAQLAKDQGAAAAPATQELLPLLQDGRRQGSVQGGRGSHGGQTRPRGGPAAPFPTPPSTCHAPNIAQRLPCFSGSGMHRYSTCGDANPVQVEALCAKQTEPSVPAETVSKALDALQDAAFPLDYAGVQRVESTSQQPATSRAAGHRPLSTAPDASSSLPDWLDTAAFDACWSKLVQDAEVREVFDSFDEDGSGNISPEEVLYLPLASVCPSIRRSEGWLMCLRPPPPVQATMPSTLTRHGGRSDGGSPQRLGQRRRW